MTTQAVSFTVPSNSWTGSIDVTVADLLADVTVADYAIFYNGTEQGDVERANWTKTSSVLLTYSGSSLDMDDVVLIRRDTPNVVVQEVTPQTTILSSLWNAEFDRVIRWREEKDIFGLNTTTNDVSDEAYGSGWNGVTNQAPSKNAVYDYIETLDAATEAAYEAYADAKVSDTAYASSWNAVTDIAPSKNAVFDYVQRSMDISHMGGRLSATTGVPITGSEVTSATLYYLPAVSDVVHLYDGTRWNAHTLTEISLSVAGFTANANYDVFLRDVSGTLTLSSISWTGYNTRNTALTRQNGVLVQSGDTTRRFLGTININATGGQITVSAGSRTTTDSKTGYAGILNQYNRVHTSYVNKASTTETISTSVTALKCGQFQCIVGSGAGTESTPTVTWYATGTSSGGALNMVRSLRSLNSISAATIFDEFNNITLYPSASVGGGGNTVHHSSFAETAASIRLQPIMSTSANSLTSVTSQLEVAYYF